MWDYAELLHKNDKFAYFTSSGDILAYLPAVIAAGVDVVRVRDSQANTQRAVSAYGSQVAFHVILDDFLNGILAPEAISERILAIRRATGENIGMIAECRVGAETPMRNVSGAMLNWRRRMPEG